MGAVKFTYPVMWCALIACVGMIGSHSIIIPMMLFGNSGWNTEFKESMELIVKFTYAFLLLGISALCFGLYLLVAPSISSNGPKNTQSSISKLQKPTEQSDFRDESHSDKDACLEEIKNVARSIPNITLTNVDMIGSLEPLETSIAKPSIMDECTKKSTIKRMGDTDASGRETASGMSCRVKKQLAAILEEFWGLLFDYHGMLTEEAKCIRAALVLDLSSNQSSELQVSAIAEDASSSMPGALMVYKNNPTLQSVSSTELPYVVIMGSLSFNGISCPPQLPPFTESYFTNCGNQLAYTTDQNEHASSSNSLQVYRYNQLGSTDGHAYSKPKEDAFSQPDVSLTWGGLSVTSKTGVPIKFLAHRETECLLIQSLRLCIRKLTRLEGSGWLFGQNDGCDEELIDHFAAMEKLLHKDDHLEENWVENKKGEQTISLSIVPYCGEGCILQARLVVSFGVWCVHRILDLLLVENRPELWGKYTYVLNRLQGILNPAFCKPRPLIFSCRCLQLPEAVLRNKERPGGVQFTSASTILELIKDVEVSISGRRGRAGTVVGNIAFPKGRENLTSVLRRYKRRLSKASS